MPGYLTDYAEQQLSDFQRGQAMTLPASWLLALASAATDSSMTELAGAGYSRLAVSRSLASFKSTQGDSLASSGSSHASSNSAALSWGNPAAAWGSASFVCFMDSAVGGNCWFYIPIPVIVISIGSPNPVQVLAGALQFALGIAGGMSDYLANRLIDLLWRGQAYSWPAQTYAALYTVTPTLADVGTEVAGGGYARVAIASSLAAWSGTQGPGTTVASSGVGGRISNNAAIAFAGPVSADWGTINGGALRDALTGGNLLWRQSLTNPRSVNAGGTPPSFAADTLGRTLD